jgi:hypothetical protein
MRARRAGHQVARAHELERSVVSHWGISGGRFPELAGAWSQQVVFIQTYSFFGQQSDVGKQKVSALMKKYPDIKSVADITPPSVTPMRMTRCS